MLRLLGKTEYGLFIYAGSIVGYLSSFCFSGACLRFYLLYKVKDDKQGVSKHNGLFISVYAYSVIGYKYVELMADRCIEHLLKCEY